MGVDAIGLRLARRPATVRVEAWGLRKVGCGRATVGSDGACESDIVGDNGHDGSDGKGEEGESESEGEGRTEEVEEEGKEILIKH